MDINVEMLMRCLSFYTKRRKDLVSVELLYKDDEKVGIWDKEALNAIMDVIESELQRQIEKHYIRTKKQGKRYNRQERYEQVYPKV